MKKSTLTLSDRLKTELARMGRGAMSRLARHVGVTPQTVRCWVEDGVEPRAGHLDKAADFLGVTPQYLRYGDDAGLAPPAAPAEPVLEYLVVDEFRLVQNFRRSTDNGKRQLLIASEATDKKDAAELPALHAATRH